MRCEDFIKSIMAFLGGRLSSEEAVWFEAHLITCERCREAFEEEKALTDTFRMKITGLAGEEFNRRVKERIDAALEQASHKEAIRFRWNPKVAAAVLIAGTAIAAIAYSLGGNLVSYPLQVAASVSANARSLFEGLVPAMTNTPLQVFESGRLTLQGVSVQLSQTAQGSPATVAGITLLAILACTGVALLYRKKITEEVTRI
jgi:predicted anti-sigma-YlaC factor YlaD